MTAELLLEIVEALAAGAAGEPDSQVRCQQALKKLQAYIADVRAAVVRLMKEDR